MKQTENREQNGTRKSGRQKPNPEYLRKRYEKRRKKRNRQIAMSRTIALFLFFAALTFIILFMTPLMNVRKIEFSGNNILETQMLYDKIGDFKGENILKVSHRDVKKRLSDNAYIKDFALDKDYFKTTLTVNILERVPCGYIEENGGYTIFDDECVILEHISEKPENIPCIKGKSGKNSSSELKLTESNIEILKEGLEVMRYLELLENVDVFNISNEDNIKFTYDDRLEVLCGSDLDLDRKIRLFEAMVSNNNLADNAKGTVDLSVTGNARYSPEIAKTEDLEKIDEENKIIGEEDPNVITGDKKEEDEEDVGDEDTEDETSDSKSKKKTEKTKKKDDDKSSDSEKEDE